ncbi:MAG: response regulator transcription factor, partial [Saprospiraceae bacterium]
MKVLIVDDEEKILASLKKGLEEHGYIVDVASNGIEGKSMALAKDYKIIISDIIMPGKSGVQMLKEIRENGLNALVLILTALNNVEDKLMVYEVGADDYLVKPFDFRELLARLKALSKRSQVSGNLGEENELVYGSLTLKT